jgi:two-component system cell cycle response regulator
MVPSIEISRFEQLKASGDLPSPKGVALAIMRLTLQDEVSVQELCRVIRTDPAFAGRLIKAANGIIGYGRRPIVAVQDALTILGLPAVRNMALGFSLLTHYRNGMCEGFDYPHFWSQSLLRALGTQMIAQRTRVTAPDEAYSLGLLANVGELALATLYPHDYGKLKQEAGANRALLRELEHRAYAMTNAELGAAMLADWGIPRLFTDAAYCVAAGQENDRVGEGSREASLALTLGLADLVGELCLCGEDARADYLYQVQRVGSRLSFDEEALALLADSVADEWQEWSHLLDLHAHAVPPYASIRQQVEDAVNAVALAQERGELIPAAQAAERKAAAPGQGNDPGTEERLRILVVSGDAAERSHLGDILGADEFTLVEAVDGDGAISGVLEFSPRLVLMDVRFQDMSGIDLLRALRKMKIGRSIYVIVMLRDVSENVVISLLEAGADDLLAKPVSARLLLAKARASRRLTVLHHEIERDREELLHVAAELAVSNRRLHEAALTDPVTEGPNRRSLADRLAQEWSQAWRDDQPLSCMIVDIDHFKRVNDSYGHDAGDMLLRGVALAMRNELRAHDLVARMGGDEFVVLCPETGIEAALACAERLRQAVAGVRLPDRLAHVRASASIGVACRDRTTADPEMLLKRADKGLYLAKQSGRDKVMMVSAEDGQMTA